MILWKHVTINYYAIDAFEMRFDGALTWWRQHNWKIEKCRMRWAPTNRSGSFNLHIFLSFNAPRERCMTGCKHFSMQWHLHIGRGHGHDRAAQCSDAAMENTAHGWDSRRVECKLTNIDIMPLHRDRLLTITAPLWAHSMNYEFFVPKNRENVSQ